MENQVESHYESQMKGRTRKVVHLAGFPNGLVGRIYALTAVAGSLEGNHWILHMDVFPLMLDLEAKSKQMLPA